MQTGPAILKGVSKLAAPVSLEHLLQVQILGLHPRPIVSETVGIRPSNPWLKYHSRWSWCLLKFENHCSKYQTNESHIKE